MTPMERYSVTTPIYYVNDVPHIGHAYSTFIADTLARYYRRTLGPKQVHFSTGTDENSQKTVEAAQRQQQEIGAYTDALAGTWRTTFEQLGISFDDFIRTTEYRHRVAVEAFLNEMDDNGDIYKGHYEGWYCVGHEAFMKEGELVDGMCPDHNRKAEWLKEENYFFKLSKYQDDLLRWFDEHPDWIVPQKRYNEVKSFVQQGLEDISITRATQRWGIPLPKDPSHVIYVWIDALINYLTTAGYPDPSYTEWWPSVHVIGKDISKFHCVIWPAMLMSAKVALPKQVVINGFFTVDGQKMSKSLGNAVSPLPLVEQYGSDAIRYFLFREIPLGEDGDFSVSKLSARYAADLANGLGNLVSRTTNMLAQYAAGKYERQPMLPEVTREGVALAIAEYRFDDALKAIWQLVDESNKIIDDRAPWKMAKEGSGDVPALLGELANRILDIADLVEPFLPESVLKIRQAFKLPVQKAAPLFPRKI